MPGGPAAEQAWKELVGASPASPASSSRTSFQETTAGLRPILTPCRASAPHSRPTSFKADRLKNIYDAYRTGLPQLS